MPLSCGGVSSFSGPCVPVALLPLAMIMLGGACKAVSVGKPWRIPVSLMDRPVGYEAVSRGPVFAGGSLPPTSLCAVLVTASVIISSEECSMQCPEVTVASDRGSARTVGDDSWRTARP